jgi:hypothetical protein
MDGIEIAEYDVQRAAHFVQPLAVFPQHAKHEERDSEREHSHLQSGRERATRIGLSGAALARTIHSV